jgi:predicted  nucleic acid-binding Zn-ribbon protein
VLGEKKSELEEIVSETKDQEEKLRVKAKKLEDKFDDDRLLQAFKRIRKNARNGLGVVYVQRNACGGCFNRIPAQRQMEIKMHKKIIVCEYCGRILIDPELAGVTDSEAQNKD